MPNLWRLQNVSIRYFRKELRARLIQLILPRAAVIAILIFYATLSHHSTVKPHHACSIHSPAYSCN